MDEKDIQANIFNKNFIVNNQNNKTETSEIESNQIGEDEMFNNFQNNNNNIIQNPLSSQTNDKAILKNFGLDFINDNNSSISMPSNTGEIKPKLIEKEIEFFPLKNPGNDNTSSNLCLKQYEFRPKLREKEIEFFPLKNPDNDNTSSNLGLKQYEFRPKLREKEIEFCPLRNPDNDNTSSNLGEKQYEFKPKLREKEIEFCPLRNPDNDNTSSNLGEKQYELNSTKFGNENNLPFYLYNSMNLQISDEYKINSSINTPEQNIKSVEGQTVPKSLTKGTDTNNSGIFPNSMFSGLQINAKAILNSLADQKTTIILQKILIESDNEQIKNIVLELKGKYRQLILDKNGNFFCKDLFKICDQKERIAILQELSPTLSEDSCNNFGTHPIQTLVEFSSCEDEYKLILSSFNDYNKLLFATVDPNGAYVIQKIITRIPERFRSNFNYIFSSFICFVCKQKYGIVTVKKFIEYTKSQKITEQILNLIKINFMNFAVDKYGNYLLQFLLEKWNNAPEGKEIKDLVANNFSIMINSKYSSFVCEVYVKLINIEEKNKIIKTLDLNEIKKSNNPHAIKILKNLGIFINNDNTEINNFQNQYQLPLSLNNNINNNMNNNGNNNKNGNKNYNYKPNKNKHKK